ncbi:PREDICTED: berberine bridge enzyme-like 15 [Ipomoea nil]|uniref:berberine bridge enzyme-like 15 n=1 Tax=Ipomoea nil TaxID=35883 RepID=UPI000901D6BA|nr:PREDICTED: berberine bridge enzyme-like 15 [Ipomoea nil]
MQTSSTASIFLSLSSLLLLFSSNSWAKSPHTTHHDHFRRCLIRFSKNSSFSDDVFTPENPSFLPILQFPIQNLRFNRTNTPRPRIIVTPRQESEVQAVVHCAKKHGIQLRARGGGHDYEGLSYTTDFENPFLVLDLAQLRSITVDAEAKTAWVGAGSTIGEVYYHVSEKSKKLGFPAGVCPTVGVGGHFTGGGYGVLLRKYGLSADNIIDARLVDAKGRILDRKAMGKNLFWAIRGGGGNSFGVVLAWKIRLVDVPETVTVFTINKTLDQNAPALVHKWQSIAHKFPKDLFIRLILKRVNSTTTKTHHTVQASFNSLYLGRTNRLLHIVQKRFPELGLTKKDCKEMTWVESCLYFGGFPIGTPTNALQRRVQLSKVRYFKAKSDYVKKPIPMEGLKGIWEFLLQDEADLAELILNPYGGRMDEISESSLPFPHRHGNLFKIQYLAYWNHDDSKASETERHINWIRKLYAYTASYVSKNPREAYVNYRDLDLGINEEGNTSYAQARKWGIRYFKNNFDRLVSVKTKVDPTNFFRNEQSVPPLAHSS